MNNDFIYVSKTFNPELPTLIVDFDIQSVDTEDVWERAYSISNRIHASTLSPIYFTGVDLPIEACHHSQVKTLCYWGHTNEFLHDLQRTFPTDGKLQICGMYRELCMVEVAALIKQSGLEIEPIIIDHDLYSISAEYSVREGDTLENRLQEHELSIQYYN